MASIVNRLVKARFEVCLISMKIARAQRDHSLSNISLSIIPLMHRVIVQAAFKRFVSKRPESLAVVSVTHGV